MALWFAALFSLSSLAVGNNLFETLIVAQGFDRLVPAAAPPLGHTARLLIAAGFGLVGAVIGHAVARLLADAPAPARRPASDASEPATGVTTADPYRVRARDAHPDAPARRPISAHDELGDDSLRASADPLPWDSIWPVETGDAAQAPPLPAWLQPPVNGGSSEVALAQPVNAALAPAVVPAPTEPAAEPEPAEVPPAAAAVADPAYPEAWRNTAERIARAHPSALSHVELIERLAMALNRQHDDATLAAEGAEPASPLPDPEGKIAVLREALASLRGG